MKNYDKLKNTELEDRYKYIESLFNHFQSLELESLKQEIKDKLLTNTNDINLLLALYFAIESKTSNKEFNYYKNIVIDIINNYEDYISILDINLNIYNIKNIDISHLVDSKTILELLYELDIYDIRDLKKLSLECVITILSSNIKKIAAYLKVIRIDNYLQSIRDIINNCFDNLNTYDRNISIFFERYGITGEALTLENIGTKYSLTRERVRQICMNKYVEVYNKYTRVQEDINTFLLSSFKFNRKYLTKEEVNIKLNDDILTNKLCFICDEFDNGIHYEKSCGVFHIKSEITIEELIKQLTNKIGKAVSQQHFQMLNPYEQRVVLNYYRITGYDNNLYVLQGCSYVDLILDLIDDNFPDGFRPSKQEQFDELNNLFKEKYGCALNMNMHALSANLARYNYISVGRGTFKKIHESIVIPYELILKIKDYIRLTEKAYYASINDQFKEELLNVGINNRYILKSILDPKLEDEFNCTRDWIEINYGVKNVNKQKKNLKPKIEIQPVKKPKIDIQPIKRAKIETQRIKKPIIENNTKSKVIVDKTEINDIIKTNISQIGKLSIKDINKRFVIINKKNELDLFVKSINKEKYLTFDLFSNCAKIYGIYNLINYLECQVLLSEQYLQIDVNTCISKNELNLDRQQLRVFKNKLNYFIDKYGSIDTREFNEYDELPGVNKTCNKYILVGLVRSYLSNYKIEYTDSRYDKTDYIIEW